MIENSQQLGEFLQAEARRRGLGLASDTHYDAQNWTLSWWKGRHRHRLDFQPMAEQGVNIVHYQDHIPWIPRTMAKLLNMVGLFSELARTEWTLLEKGRFPIEAERVQSLVAHCPTLPRTAAGRQDSTRSRIP
jgi:hypothetical protein